MIFLDATLRFSGLGILLILIISILVSNKKSIRHLLLLLSCISISCLLLGFSPEYVTLPHNVKFVIRFMDIPHLVFIWLFALSLFQKNFRLNKNHFLILFVYSLLIVLVRLGQFGVLSQPSYFWYLYVSLFSIGLMIHLITVTLYEKKDDLVEKRRQARDYFVLVISFITISVAVSEIFLLPDHLDVLYTAKAGIILVGIVSSAVWLLRLNGAPFHYNKRYPNSITDREREIISRLTQEVKGSKAYLEPKLSPEFLAKKLGIAPYKLREIINKTLAYQNFSDYINSYRIDAVKELLNDPKKRDIPILTIALSCGFSSLSSFNRVFKLKEGMTPSDYRKSLSD